MFQHVADEAERLNGKVILEEIRFILEWQAEEMCEFLQKEEIDYEYTRHNNEFIITLE